MKYTSAEAAKLLKKLNEDLEAVAIQEENSKSFLAAMGEDVEELRPEYDFTKTQSAIKELHVKIRKVKHSINVFNSVTIVPDFNMTIDEMLIYIPQLSSLKQKLACMKGTPKMAREYSRLHNIIDYRYANYDISEADEEYRQISDLLAKAQISLDVVNNTKTFEIDF